jgi:hypothetical protein
VFNGTFSNISAISWRPVLKVEEAGIPDHEQATGKLYSGVNVVGMVKEKIEVF